MYIYETGYAALEPMRILRIEMVAGQIWLRWTDELSIAVSCRVLFETSEICLEPFVGFNAEMGIPSAMYHVALYCWPMVGHNAVILGLSSGSWSCGHKSMVQPSLVDSRPSVLENIVYLEVSVRTGLN